MKFLKTHVDNVRKRTEKVYENAQSESRIKPVIKTRKVHYFTD